MKILEPCLRQKKSSSNETSSAFCNLPEQWTKGLRSGFAFVFQRNQSAIAKGTIENMLAAIGRNGPDGKTIRYFRKNTKKKNTPLSVGMGRHHFWTTPEEHGVEQPLTSAQGHSILFDGRLDNRAELYELLTRHKTLPRLQEISDTELILHAYEKWKRRCFHHLLGPFAITIYDASKEEVILARDPMGSRSLVYSCNDDFLAVASEIPSLLAHPQIPIALDKQGVAESILLFEHFPETTATRFQNIHSLLPGQIMRIGKRSIHSERSYPFRLGALRNYSSMEECAEHFRIICTAAVKSRLRSIGEVGVELSGGLDSSTVTGLAAMAQKEAGKALATFSCTFSDPYSQCDESLYRASLQACHRNIVSHDIACNDYSLQFSHPANLPLHPSTSLPDVTHLFRHAMFQEAQNRNIRTMLTGLGGDELFPSKASLYSWRNRLQHWLPIGIYHFFQRLRRQDDFPRQKYLTSFAQSILSQQSSCPRDYFRARRPQQYLSILGLRTSANITGVRFFAESDGIEERHPFRDRRVAEFLLTVPDKYLCDSQGGDRLVLREAMKEIVPEMILSRTTGEKTLFTPFLISIVEHENMFFEQLLNTPNAFCWEYFERDFLRHIWNNPPVKYGEGAIVLLTAAMLQLWHRECFCPLKTNYDPHL